MSAPVPTRFAHLHQHTAYSLLDGAARIKDLMAWVKEVTPDNPSLAMTDHGNMHGAVEFTKAAIAAGVKPIIGLEAYTTPGSRFDKRRIEGIDGGYHHLTLLAKDLTGYRNLTRLSSRAFLEGFYMKPRIDFALLEEHHEGIIALSGCLGAHLPRTILDVGPEAGEALLQRYLKLFGDDYFIEIQNHGLSEQERLNPVLRDLAQRYGIAMVATNDGHYVRKDDARAHEALLAIQTKTVLSDPNRFRFSCDEFYVKTPQEMAAVISEAHFPGALANTLVVAERCNLELPIGSKRVYQMPELPLPAGRTLAEQLRVETYEGLTGRYPERFSEALWGAYLAHADGSGRYAAPLEEVWVRLARHAEQGRRPARAEEPYDRYETPHLDAFAETWGDATAIELLRRAEFELGVIIAMGFPDYFLIVADFINWAKSHGIAVGPGRGSGAGSIVAYALRITNIDPIVYGLLFERFLNPDRVSMPDFDIDFSDARRGEVIEYVRGKYGDDRVAHIATFGTMASKAAIKDAARVMEASFSDADKVSKLIPVVFGRSVKIEAALEEIPELRELYHAGAKPYVDVAMSLEGLTRHASVHAAGVIIARDPITDLAPLFRSGDGPIVCQYDMASVEELGFVKMDFLGLRTLTLIETAVRIVRTTYGERLDPDNFPVDDPETYALLARGEAAGVFQFESPGMIDTLRKLRPRRIQDLIAVSALFRPGPMENIPTYIRRHHGQEEVAFDDFPHAAELLGPILAETYGIPVYQEQIMQIAQVVAGYTLGQADLLRRAMGKKKIAEMVEQRAIFERGARERSIPSPEANRIFDLLERFANYGFNKSHSAAYGLISFQTAYLKAHYPVAFAAALLSVERGDSDKVAQYVVDARSLGIAVLPPDINTSNGDFTPDGDVVRFGLYGVKNVGDAAVDFIVRERKQAGRYRDLFDFCRRVDNQLVNKRALESLVKSGAFDTVGDRTTLLGNLEVALRWGAAQRDQASKGQLGLFGSDEIAPPVLESGAAPLGNLELLRMEKEALGLYLSSHPMAGYPGLAEAATCKMADVDAWWRGRLREGTPNGRVRVALAGLIQGVTKRPTRKGTMMARFELADASGAREIVVFGRSFDEMAPKLIEDAPAVVICEASEDGEAVRLVAERVIRWDERESAPALALLRIDLDDVADHQLLGLRSLLDEHHGRVPVELQVRSAPGTLRYLLDGVRIDAEALPSLRESVPWVDALLTVDVRPLLEDRGRPRFGPPGTAGGPPAPPTRNPEVPF
jgi:DNA polymerase III subunit alpha